MEQQTATNIEKLRKNYEAYVERNNHTKAAKLLVDAFGSAEEQAEIRILYAKENLGSLSDTEKAGRDYFLRKYHKVLIKLTK
jgi:hypothetical protein